MARRPRGRRRRGRPLSTHIVLLDETTANRIAAGEVVERPASAVKELVENAIDAGAGLVAVDLVEGGKRRIVVSDNGSGMSAEDAVLSIQRHATSKIRTGDDLFRIRTLGFRGEALPSIASVSRFTLTTKRADAETGTRLSVAAGALEAVEAVGCPDGTQVVVEDLFQSLPARLKFLKSTPTELSRAVESVGHLSLAHPHIAFRVRHGDQQVLSTPGGGDPLAALAAVWGRDVARSLRAIAYDSSGLHVSGLICTPDRTRPGRSHELFFVNRRPVRSRLLAHAVEEAFRSLTPEGRYPIAAVFVEIAADLVDVNVHPAKAEVKFTRDGEVHHAVGQAVREAIMEHGILPTVTGRWGIAAPAPSAGAHPILPGPQFERLGPAPGADPGTPSEAFAEMVELRDESGGAAPAPEAAPDTRPFAEQLRGFRVLGQARNTFIVALTDHGVALVDQHVAHERVLYERLSEWRGEQGIPVQRLAVPMTLQLGAAEAALVRQRLAEFGAVGWELEPFGRGAFMIRSAPAFAGRKAQDALLRDMVDELAHQSVSRRLLVQQEHVTITSACKMAVKAGDALTVEEMSGLLQQLADTRNPYVCPHGRPIVVTLPFTEIERRFRR